MKNVVVDGALVVVVAVVVLVLVVVVVVVAAAAVVVAVLLLAVLLLFLSVVLFLLVLLVLFFVFLLLLMVFWCSCGGSFAVGVLVVIPARSALSNFHTFILDEFSENQSLAASCRKSEAAWRRLPEPLASMTPALRPKSAAERLPIDLTMRRKMRPCCFQCKIYYVNSDRTFKGGPLPMTPSFLGRSRFCFLLWMGLRPPDLCTNTLPAGYEPSCEHSIPRRGMVDD